MSIASCLKFPPSLFTDLKSQSLQVINDLQCTPITTANRNANITPGDGMIVFNEDDNEFQGYYSGTWNTLQGSTGATGATGTNNQISATGTISSADIYSLSTVPVTAISAQGTGTIVIPTLYTLQYNPGTTGFTGTVPTSIQLRYNNFATTSMGAIGVTLTGITGSYGYTNSFSHNSSAPSVYNNQPITFRANLGPSSQGDGNLTWLINYTVVTIV